MRVQGGAADADQPTGNLCPCLTNPPLKLFSDRNQITESTPFRAKPARNKW